MTETYQPGTDYQKIELLAADQFKKILAGTDTSGNPVYLDGQTIAMLDAADQRLPFDLAVVQGSYSTSVSASGSTHAGGGAIDVSVAGHSEAQIDQMVLVMRQLGFAAWHRTPAEGYPPHIHAVVLDDLAASDAAKNQMNDYRLGYNGLHYGEADDGPRVPIHPFDYQAALTGNDFTGNALTADHSFDPTPGNAITATDSDGDGLTDEFEKLLGTDPTKVDTDGDGLSDEVETYQTHTDPLVANDPHTVAALLANPGSEAAHQARIPLAALKAGFGGGATMDHDHDGLSDLTEAQLGTNPYAADSDHDGVSDGVEHRLGSNPLDIDTNHDGLTDNIEYDHGTLGPAPLDPTTDPTAQTLEGITSHT